jgi:glycosyltransferase involved in cell wall biosynthesis
VSSSRAADLALRAIDASLAAAVIAGGAGVLLGRRVRRRTAPVSARPRLLAISTMYSLEIMRARRAEYLVTHRDLDGYFERVWSVHPLVGADPNDAGAGVGAPTVTVLNDVHTMIEGTTQRFRGLSRLPIANFVLAQVQLVLLLDRLVRREGIAIVRGDPYYNGLIATVLGRANGRPVELRIIADADALYAVTGLLTYPRLFPSRAIERRVARYTMSRAQSVLCCGDHRPYALRNGARAECLGYAGNWSMVNPLHLGEPAEREPLGDEFGFGNRPVVAYVGRLDPTKHPEDVIVSLAKAHERNPSLAAVMVGDGPLRDDLSRLAAELGVQDDVAFAGARDQVWIARMLTQSAVVAAPLAGLSLVESALSGTPIVAYDHDWHPDLLTNAENGLLVTYRDTAAMAAAIGELIGDPVRSARLAAAARKRALAFTQPSKLLAYERALADDLLSRVGSS